LEGVVCKSDFHRLCPRAIYPFWRENWLKRAGSAAVPSPEQERAPQDEAKQPGVGASRNRLADAAPSIVAPAVTK